MSQWGQQQFCLCQECPVHVEKKQKNIYSKKIIHLDDTLIGMMTGCKNRKSH